MSMDEFVNSLTDEQKAKLLSALCPDKEPVEEPVQEPIQETATRPAEDFTMHKNKSDNGIKNRRREPVRAKQNTWTDTGEHRNVETPQTQRTPRNRPPPKKKDVRCHACGKNFRVNANIVYGEYYRCDRCTGK